MSARSPLPEQLQALADPEYRAFEAKLCPTLPIDCFLGVRVPALRKLAASFAQTPECQPFLHALPHRYYDENLLHAILLSKGKEFGNTLTAVESFLPYVDNWAVCDTLRPKVFGKHTEELLPHIRGWIASSAEYTRRFGVDMLMTYYLDEAFSPELPEWVAAVPGEEYYVRMMAAWYFATALSKRWEEIIPYLEQRRLPDWTHRKAIQKAKESYRITPEQKAYLQTLL